MTTTGSADRLLAAFRAYLAGLQRGLVSEFVDAIDWTMPARVLPARPLPCTAYLADVATAASTPEQVLLAQLAANAPELHWGQTYTAADFGQPFIDNYGWLELFGTRGHFVNDKVAAGFLILGPKIVYPDHHHIAEELYVPLTGGTRWRKGEGDFVERAAGEVIHHPPNVSHAMRTGSAPLVALYLWRGGPLAQKSTIGTAG